MRYGNDLRRRVVSFVRGGGSKAEAARRFSVSRVTVYGWLRKGGALGEFERPGPRGPRKFELSALEAAVSAHPDRTLAEHGAAFGVHASTVCRALRRLGLTRKKRPGATRSGTRRGGGRT